MDTKSLAKAERKRQLTKRLSDLYGAQVGKVRYDLIRTSCITAVDRTNNSNKDN